MAAPVTSRTRFPRRWMAAAILLGAGLGWTASVRAADSQVAISMERKELWVADHDRLPIMVEELTDDARRIGLTHDRVRRRVELRLREAGIVPRQYRMAAPNYLRTDVHVVGGAYQIRVEFYRSVYYNLPDRTKVRILTPTWDTGATGNHGGEVKAVLAGLDARLDHFLNTYLRANQAP